MEEFAPYRVALVIRYQLLKQTLNTLIDLVCIGLTRYEYKPTDRYNMMNFIFTKGAQFAKEREIRIVMSCYGPAQDPVKRARR